MIAKTNGVVEVAGLSRRFGRIQALDGVYLEVPRGSVFGLVGENGAGKTTLIKHLLGLLKAQTGTVRVLGLDPVLEPVGVLARVGYLSEDRDMPEWMRISELLRYLKAFYPSWDDVFADELRRQFDLDPRARIKTLSQGQRARLGLLAALAYRPEVLILDEPSTGLDPIVRRDAAVPAARAASGGRPAVALPGLPFPLGATVGEHLGIAVKNSAIASSVASSVTLCLFDDAGAETQIPLRDNDADVWHAFVPGAGPGSPTGTGSAGPGTRPAGSGATRPSCCSTPTRRRSAERSRSGRRSWASP